MNELFNKVLEYTNQLVSENPFKNLLIKVDVEADENHDQKRFSVKSTPKIGVKNSFLADMKIKEYFAKESEKYPEIEPFCLVVTYEKKTNDKKTMDNNKSVSESVTTSFHVENPKYSLEDVILPSETVEEIKNSLSLIDNFDLIYHQWGWADKEPAAKTIMCFYGKPGTGKTMCAHAVAKYLNKKILVASYADIQSEYVGVGPKNLKAVFEQAEKEAAVLFFDEADSFLRKRTSDTSSSASMHYNSMTNEMMKHLEDFNGLVIFATNLTENTDEAFKTRITCSVEFVVPDEDSRAKIISYMIPKNVPLTSPFDEEDYLKMAKTTDGFVGRDIRNAVKYVLTEGARNNKYPFTCDDFILGFEHYKENKDKLNDSINGGKDNKINPLDLYTETNCILNLITYAAWFDGEETDEESSELKDKAKLLNRNKIVIRKLSDLPALEEICEGIKHEQTKQMAIEYVSDVLSLSGEDERNVEFIKGVAKMLSVEEQGVEEIIDYFRMVQNKRMAINQMKALFESKESSIE